jgi:CheY-like chemotaxis protein
MPRGGLLTIGTQAVTLDQAAASAFGLPAGRYAILAVADSGVGMDEPTRQRIFEPFFTTKPQGKGTGLGLSIVYGIVMQHGGQIEVASAPGRGTTFRIYLPLSREAVAPAAPAAPEVVRGGTETVLLAEDNEHVRALARTVLEAAGYRVLEARDGREALALDEAQGDGIDLCLFDVVMPGMGGREALEAIRARRPGRRAVFMSGYAPDAAGRAWPLDAPLLGKPFLPRDLLLRVREALDA